MKIIFQIAAVFIAITSSSASAGVTNGDFTQNLSGWQLQMVGIEISWSGTGGNPGGFAFVGGDVFDGTATLTQTIEASGSPSSECLLTFDFRTITFDGAAPLRGAAKGGYTSLLVWSGDTVVYNEFLLPNYNYQGTDWHEKTASIPCGSQIISFEIVTDDPAGHSGCDIGLDNVAVSEIVPIESASWSRVKSLYR